MRGWSIRLAKLRGPIRLVRGERRCELASPRLGTCFQNCQLTSPRSGRGEASHELARLVLISDCHAATHCANPPHEMKIAYPRQMGLFSPILQRRIQESTHLEPKSTTGNNWTQTWLRAQSSPGPPRSISGQLGLPTVSRALARPVQARLESTGSLARLEAHLSPSEACFASNGLTSWVCHTQSASKTSK